MPTVLDFQINSWSSPLSNPSVKPPKKLNNFFSTIKDWSPKGSFKYFVLKFAPIELYLSFYI